MARRAAADLVDQELPGLELDADPEPRAPRRGRPRKTTTPVKAAGTRGKIPARTSSGQIMSKNAMISKVQGEIYTWLSLFAAAWEIRDPECASVLYEPATVPGPNGPAQVERLAAITDRLVAMIARNDAVLETLAKSGIIGDAAVLGGLLLPVGRQLWRAHGPMGVGHAQEGQESADDVAAQYPAYAGR